MRVTTTAGTSLPAHQASKEILTGTLPDAPFLIDSLTSQHFLFPANFSFLAPSNLFRFLAPPSNFNLDFICKIRHTKLHLKTRGTTGAQT